MHLDIQIIFIKKIANYLVDNQSNLLSFHECTSLLYSLISSGIPKGNLAKFWGLTSKF